MYEENENQNNEKVVNNGIIMKMTIKILLLLILAYQNNKSYISSLNK